MDTYFPQGYRYAIDFLLTLCFHSSQVIVVLNAANDRMQIFRFLKNLKDF